MKFMYFNLISKISTTILIKIVKSAAVLKKGVRVKKYSGKMWNDKVYQSRNSAGQYGTFLTTHRNSTITITISRTISQIFLIRSLKLLFRLYTEYISCFIRVTCLENMHSSQKFLMSLYKIKIIMFRVF